MEIASIKGDTVLLVYHPAEGAATVGEQFSAMELPDQVEGLVIQVISNDSLEYSGLQQEMIQGILQERFAQIDIPVNRERGMQELKSLKLATAKIRKRIRGNQWVAWDGWIPTRNVEISPIDAQDLLNHVLPARQVLLQSFANSNGSPVSFEGPGLNMINVLTGVKGSGKSHLAKHLVLALCTAQVPCIVFDLNGEYIQLPDAQVLEWGGNFRPDLAEVGFEMLEEIVRTIYPLQPGSPSEGIFENRLPNIFNTRRQRLTNQGQPFAIDIPFLRQAQWGGGDFVEGAITRRLELIDRMNLFKIPGTPETTITSINAVYEGACAGRTVVFDMRQLGSSLQHALVKSITRSIESICDRETEADTGRYPFVFFEEAHFYISESAIMNIITRGRHIGMASVFVTNTPEKLPDSVFRQLDNLFLLSLSHKDDIRNVSKNSFTDHETIESFATRMPNHHALIVGNVTDRYPLVLNIEDLPAGVPRTGVTRSTWDRFNGLT